MLEALVVQAAMAEAVQQVMAALQRMVLQVQQTLAEAAVLAAQGRLGTMAMAATAAQVSS